MSFSVRAAALDALALVLPIECAGCGADDRALCDRCRAALAPEPTKRRLADGTPVFSGLDYDGVVRRVVLALKEQQRTDLARQLAPALAAAVRAAVDDATGGATGGVPGLRVADLQVVAVPGTRAAYRRRGYDPVRLLLARAGLGERRVFAAARPHAVQKGLGIDAREANLVGAFRLRRAVDGIHCLLIDDVVTTGSTLVEAAQVLRAGGADVVAAATVASTPRRIGPLVTAGRGPVGDL
ncbi:ComF family protein [soil metagenome]